MLESRDEISIRKSFADELWSESFILSTCDRFYNSFSCNRFVINFVLKFSFLVYEKFFSYTRIREEIIPRIEVTFAEDCKLCYYSDSGQWFTRHVRWCATARSLGKRYTRVESVWLGGGERPHYAVMIDVGDLGKRREPWPVSCPHSLYWYSNVNWTFERLQISYRWNNFRSLNVIIDKVRTSLFKDVVWKIHTSVGKLMAWTRG